MSEDIVDANERWVPEEQYKLITASVPILCVDLLPLSAEPEPEIGLIRRTTYDGGEGWCLVGGAVLKDEPVRSAVERHLKATLGSDMELDASALQFVDVFEYFTRPDIGELYDPRKHAVSLTYTARCSGSVELPAGGEALEFRWFEQAHCSGVDFGFGQDLVVSRGLRMIQARQGRTN